MTSTSRNYTIGGIIALIIVVAGIWWYNAANPGAPAVPNTGTDASSTSVDDSGSSLNASSTIPTSGSSTTPAMDPNAKG